MEQTKELLLNIPEGYKFKEIKDNKVILEKTRKMWYNVDNIKSKGVRHVRISFKGKKRAGWDHRRDENQSGKQLYKHRPCRPWTSGQAGGRAERRRKA